MAENDLISRVRKLWNGNGNNSAYRTSPLERATELLAVLRSECPDIYAQIGSAKEMLDAPPKLLVKPSTTKMEVIALPGDYLLVKNIRCIGSDGQCFEEYPELLVAKGIVREEDGKPVHFTTYEAISHFEQQGNGLFLPDVATSCNFIVALYENKDNPEVKLALDMYKDYKFGHGWHAQGTIVDGNDCRIIHNANENDFPSYGGSNNVNSGRKIERRFRRDGDWKASSLARALKEDDKLCFIKDLTGLPNPEVIVEIGGYLGGIAWFHPPAMDGVCSAWLGCNYGYQFSIYADNNLNSSNVARGVRRR